MRDAAYASLIHTIYMTYRTGRADCATPQAVRQRMTGAGVAQALQNKENTLQLSLPPDALGARKPAFLLPPHHYGSYGSYSDRQ